MQNRDVIVVDDIIDTGIRLQDTLRLLKLNGARKYVDIGTTVWLYLLDPLQRSVVLSEMSVLCTNAHSRSSPLFPCIPTFCLHAVLAFPQRPASVLMYCGV